MAVPVDGKPAPLDAPRGLDKETAAVFARIAAAVPRGHFVESDVALVTEYCRAVLTAKRADAELRKNGPVDVYDAKGPARSPPRTR